MPRDPVKLKAAQKATAQRYNQSDKGKATAQRAKQRVAERAASAASGSLAFLTELKKLPHAQRVKDYFSEEELAAAADKVPPSLLSVKTRAEPRWRPTCQRPRALTALFSSHQLRQPPQRRSTASPALAAGE
jgi:hypothetical protein